MNLTPYLDIVDAALLAFVQLGAVLVGVEVVVLAGLWVLNAVRGLR